MKKVKESEKNKTAKSILAIISFIIIIILLVGECSDSKEKVPEIPYSEMLLPQKKAFLLDFINGVSDENMLLQIKTEDYIKNSFKFPEEVEFINKPYMYKAQIISLDSGYVAVQGIVTAKNAFGVKSRHQYFAKYKITDSVKTIIDINVK
jgi:hypothetical protein